MNMLTSEWGKSQAKLLVRLTFKKLSRRSGSKLFSQATGCVERLLQLSAVKEQGLL
jgi:hypothetical protein